VEHSQAARKELDQRLVTPCSRRRERRLERFSTWTDTTTLTRIMHEPPAATADLAVLPGVLGSSFGRLRTSSPCDVLNKYASGPSPAMPRDGCPVARSSPRSRDGVSCIMRVKASPLPHRWRRGLATRHWCRRVRPICSLGPCEPESCGDCRRDGVDLARMRAAGSRRRAASRRRRQSRPPCRTIARGFRSSAPALNPV
jgi:hypothetical protein